MSTGGKFGRLRRRRNVVGATAIVALYAVVALLGSIAWTDPVAPGTVARPRSLIDRCFPADFAERSYSAPLAAVEFYGGLFGWEFEDVMPPGAPGTYVMARLRGLDVAAVGSVPEGAPPMAMWNTPRSRPSARPSRRLKRRLCRSEELFAVIGRALRCLSHLSREPSTASNYLRISGSAF